MSYPKEQIQFLQAVQDMRDAQRDYFQQPNDYRLKISIRKEQHVDSLLKPFILEGVIKEKDRKPVTNTPNLFS